MSIQPCGHIPPLPRIELHCKPTPREAPAQTWLEECDESLRMAISAQEADRIWDLVKEVSRNV